jgi:phosphomevalonate kinase
MSHDLVVSAPGKLMIIGEYAVLEGAEAVVAAVDRRAYARVRTGELPAAAAEARAAYARVERTLGALGAEPSVDVSRLRAQHAKLGLGSSAAAAAAAAGLALAQHGREWSSDAGRVALFDAAFQGHKDIAPQGSGADVAASVYGGFIRFRRRGESAEVTPIAWPSELTLQVVWTGQEARTSTFLASVSQLASAQPELYRARMDALTLEAARFIAALRDQRVLDIIESTAAYGRSMAALGEAAGVPIVSDVLSRVAELALHAGGAAKPSGAGGGDVALALFPDEQRSARFAALCREQHFESLELRAGAPGARIEQA